MTRWRPLPAAYVQQFEHGKQLLAALDIRPGQKVLDIGTGTGRLAIYVAGLIGPSGRVVGIDPLPTRIESARYPQRKWGLEYFGWCILAAAVSAPFHALVGAHSYDGRIELYAGLYFGGYGINAPLGVVDFFWSKFARERATSPDA